MLNFFKRKKQNDLFNENKFSTYKLRDWIQQSSVGNCYNLIDEIGQLVVKIPDNAKFLVDYLKLNEIWDYYFDLSDMSDKVLVEYETSFFCDYFNIKYMNVILEKDNQNSLKLTIKKTKAIIDDSDCHEHVLIVRFTNGLLNTDNGVINYDNVFNNVKILSAEYKKPSTNNSDLLTDSWNTLYSIFSEFFDKAKDGTTGSVFKNNYYRSTYLKAFPYLSDLPVTKEKRTHFIDLYKQNMIYKHSEDITRRAKSFQLKDLLNSDKIKMNYWIRLSILYKEFDSKFFGYQHSRQVTRKIHLCNEKFDDGEFIKITLSIISRNHQLLRFDFSGDVIKVQLLNDNEKIRLDLLNKATLSTLIYKISKMNDELLIAMLYKASCQLKITLNQFYDCVMNK